MNSANQETEIKLAVKDAGSARRLLRKAGFRVIRRRVFEANTVLDSADLVLRSSSRLLRVRAAGPVATLTYKGAAAPGRHKSREELEVTVSDAARVSLIAGRLGFHAVFRYEKYRTEFRRGREHGTAVLDETPIGVYLELEGAPNWIDRNARELGFAEEDFITASYGRLYLDWCASHKRKPGDMVFR